MMPDPTRRQLMQATAALGIGTIAFQRALAAQIQPDDPPKAETRPTRVTAEMIKQAEWIAGITLTESQREAAATSLTGLLRRRVAAHAIPAPNGLPPVIHFDPRAGLQAGRGEAGEAKFNFDLSNLEKSPKPDAHEDLAFAGVAKLAALLRAKKVSSVELTKFFLDRLKKYDPLLFCVACFTEATAMKQAEQADEEIAAGRFRSLVHGIPWGAKDLIAYPGYPTAWGAEHFRKQTYDTKATVAAKLDDAGAVLCAKLSLGTLALGDRWYGGMTRNPWDNGLGSSGSSAGSASAVAAGLLPFAIGSETLGSIISPSTRCGVTGLRPTFGRVSRAGCMTLAWTLDKLGPFARSAEDCAIVLNVIHGADPADAPAVTEPFGWPMKRGFKELRVGYFESKKAVGERAELKVLEKLGVKLVPIKLPDRIPTDIITTILDAEAAAAFDDITHAGVSEGIGTWGSTFRRGRFISAVDYLRANRLRGLLMREMATLMDQIDLYVAGNDLVLTNLTGHPTINVPNGPPPAGLGSPPMLAFTGRLYGETELLSLVAAYQRETDFLKHRPKLDKLKLLPIVEKKP